MVGVCGLVCWWSGEVEVGGDVLMWFGDDYVE